MTPKPPGTSLPVKINGARHRDRRRRFYLGKRCAFVYRASKEVRGTKLRVIWGTLVNVHGTFVIFVLFSSKDRLLTCIASRKFRIRSCPIQAQSPSPLLRCLGTRHAVSFVHMSIIKVELWETL